MISAREAYAEREQTTGWDDLRREIANGQYDYVRLRYTLWYSGMFR